MIYYLGVLIDQFINCFLALNNNKLNNKATFYGGFYILR
jgi:hypothetical protein